ncbi:MAG: hypothetical protein ACI4D7_02365 [Lachnospiraceae bacterium]
MSKHGSLTYQMTQQLQKMYTPGVSKRAIVDAAYKAAPPNMSKQEVKNEACRPYIFATQTLNTYKKEVSEFAKYCKSEHGAKTVVECRTFATEYLQKSLDEGKSVFTVSTQASALGKLYQESYTNFITLPQRERANITRSRLDRPSDKHFSGKKNQELVNFCQGTGLRRSELQKLTPEALVIKNGDYYLKVTGKGGKTRISPIIGPHKAAIVNRIQSTPPSCKVWQRVNKHADIHAYRSYYATTLYKSVARDVTNLPASERYCCRKDRAGDVFDRKAMKIVSQALGHNRIEVIASNYLRDF